MTRKSEVVFVPQGAAFPRDGGKAFMVTEWPSNRGERWAIKFLLACSRGGNASIRDLVGRGMEAVFWIGLDTLLAGRFDADEVVPLLDELLECVQCVRDPSSRDAEGKHIPTAVVSDDDVADIPTRMWLRSEVLRVHTGFSPADTLASLLSWRSTSTQEATAST